ncbi:MAG: citrate/2-methylcitrate synthase [Longimicrobiales bacterium]
MAAGRGLEGVVAAETRLSQVLGEEGRLIYAGYEIDDLAEHVTFEEVCHLLWYGDLPTRSKLDRISQRLAAGLPVNGRIVDMLRLVPDGTHPMTTLRTAVSALAFYDPDTEDNSAEANERKAIRLTAQAITITAAIERTRNGLDPVEPRGDLNLAANLLYMMRGEVPDELSARIVDAALTLHAEHGMNASTFAGRVAAGTMSDMHAAVTAAIATLKGPLHGGANERVMKMLQQIADPSAAANWVRGALARGEKIMGFGHRVYRTLDPRAPILKRLAEELNRSGGEKKWLDISERIQATMGEEMEKKGKPIYPNVDFFSASVYYTLGIPVDLFTTIFACARMAGWTAHIIEQHQDNRLIRPRAQYVGPTGLEVTPIEHRG